MTVPSLSVILLAYGMFVASAGDGVNLVRDLPGLRAAVSVDSRWSGYGIDVLSDGTWIEKGKEITQDFGSRDRLGNCGNSWVSGGGDAEHWIRVDWPQPVTVAEVEVWWTIPRWSPRAFRVEYFSDGKWEPALGRDVWLTATDRHSAIAFAPRKLKSLRIVQAPHGSEDRGLMGAQEVLAFGQPREDVEIVGARELSPVEFRRLQPQPFVRNIALLHEQCPRADRGVTWSPEGKTSACGRLNDGDVRLAAEIPEGMEGLGIEWPIRHVIDGTAIISADRVAESSAFRLEVHDGEKWVPVRVGLACKAEPEKHRLVYAFEPIATKAIRACELGGERRTPIVEMEVYRYLPPGKNVWPERLVKENRFEREILAAKEDPSFESVSLAALSMTPARALLGLKDTPHEIGVAWDGTLIGKDTFQFSFGEESLRLADRRETVRRSLIDGWRPGVVVEGQVDELAIRQTAFLVPLRGDASPPALFVRFNVRNLSRDPVRTCVTAETTGRRSGPFQVKGNCLLSGGDVVLLSKAPSRPDERENVLRIDLQLAPGQEMPVDFIYPHSKVRPGEALQTYQAASFEEHLAAFKQYWDDLLAPAMTLDLPETRVNRLYKAVLTQIFINGDGDVMRYGSEPSVYSEQLYGVEEGFCMTALAQSGLYRDAQRYLDGTYLTADFLKKVETYKTYVDRHQQYRNGLQPHYAVTAYRFSRDEAWIRKHLKTLRECAEWTITQRKKTMQLEGGSKPLHWGLLPKWSYGGDIADLQCYPLYANLCCWRGLEDTAWLLRELGDEETAARYTTEAQAYRRVIDEVIDAIYQSDRDPPFLPGRVYGKGPVGNDYYQLFMGVLLDLHPFDMAGKRLSYVTDFLERDNRTFCLMPRFRRDVGPGGLDGIYGLGYVLSKLHQDSIEEFLLGFYGYLAFNMDHDTFASRETNLIYASDFHVRSQYRVPEMSDPLPCSSAVALHFLRNMLLTEELTGPGSLSGNLLLLYGVPRRWLRDGETIRVRQAPTHYGEISFEVVSKLQEGRIEARIVPPLRNGCKQIKLRLRHPENRRIQRVLVNGQPWQQVDQRRQLILLPARNGPCQVVASY